MGLTYGLTQQNAPKTAYVPLYLMFLTYNRRIQTDNKKIHEIKELLKNNVILKPDKGEGVVIISKTENKNSMQSLFSDRVSASI